MTHNITAVPPTPPFVPKPPIPLIDLLAEARNAAEKLRPHDNSAARDLNLAANEYDWWAWGADKLIPVTDGEPYWLMLTTDPKPVLAVWWTGGFVLNRKTRTVPNSTITHVARVMRPERPANPREEAYARLESAIGSDPILRAALDLLK